MLNRRGGDESVRDFQTVTLGEFAQERSGKFSDFVVRLDTDQRAKKDRDKLMFVWTSTCPNFRRDHWRVVDNHSRRDQC